MVINNQKDGHTELSKSEREGGISNDFPYMRNLKSMLQMNLLKKQKETHRHRVNLWLLGGGWWEGMVREFGMDMCALLCLK